MSHSMRVAAVILVLSTCCQAVAQSEKRPAQAKTAPVQNAQVKKPVAGKALPVQGAVDPRTANKEQRPVGQPLRVDAISPELEQLLADWEAASSQIKTMTGTFFKYTYSHRFQVEYRAEGEFLYEAPDRGVYKTKPGVIKKGMVGRKTNQNREPCEPYSLKSDAAERWICTGAQIKTVNETEKSYRVADIPASSQGTNIVESPLPFLFGMKADQAKRRYSMELLSHDTKKGDYLLKVIPKLQMDAQNYSEAYVIIDDKEFLPKAVRLIEPGGTQETVHNFTELQVNEPTDSLAKLYVVGKEYRLVVENAQAGAAVPGRAPARGQAVPPQGRKPAPTKIVKVPEPEGEVISGPDNVPNRNVQGPSKTRRN